MTQSPHGAPCRSLRAGFEGEQRYEVKTRVNTLVKNKASSAGLPSPMCPLVRQLTGFHPWGVLMSTRDKSLFTSTALAVAFAVTTLAGSAFAADMQVKAS